MRTQPAFKLVKDALLSGVKRPGREADHSPPSNAERSNELTDEYALAPVYTFMARTETTLPLPLPL